MKRFIISGAVLTCMVLLLAVSGFMADKKFGREKVSGFKIPVLIQKEKPSTACLMPQYMLNAWYHIERMEKISDTIDLIRKGKRISDSLYFQFEDPTGGKLQAFSNSELMVVVDTVNALSIVKKPIWASWLFHRSFDDKRLLLQDDTLVQEVSGFAVYVANVSPNKTASIEIQDGSLMMVLQAQDERHVWRNIEYWRNSWCGNSYFTLNVPPQHLLLTRGIKCSGDFKTVCRLKVNSNEDTLFSNSFTMFISKGQFIKPKE